MRIFGNVIILGLGRSFVIDEDYLQGVIHNKTPEEQFPGGFNLVILAFANILLYYHIRQPCLNTIHRLNHFQLINHVSVLFRDSRFGQYFRSVLT